MQIDFPQLVNNSESSILLTFYFKKKSDRSISHAVLSAGDTAPLRKIFKVLFEKAGAQILVDNKELLVYSLYTNLKFNFTVTSFFPPRQTNDLIAFQVKASTFSRINVAWKSLRAILRSIFSKLDINISQTQYAIIGYSMVYQAGIAFETKGEDVCLSRRILEVALPLFHNTPGINLAFHEQSEGLMFLIENRQNHGRYSGITYVGFYQNRSTNSFYLKNFHVEGGRLNYIDVYAHKSTYQWSQLQDKSYIEFNEELDLLAAQTGRVLTNIQPFRYGSSLYAIESVTKRTARIMNMRTEYLKLSLSIESLKRNFEILYHPEKVALADCNKIFEYHYLNICDQSDGFKLILARCNIIIDQATMAIGLIESSQNKVSTQRIGSLQIYFAAWALFGVFAQINPATAITLLKQVSIIDKAMPASSVSFWTVLAAKFIAFIVLMLLLYALYGIYNHLKTKLQLRRMNSMI